MLPRLFRTDTEIRKRQINTLKIFNENVTEITEDFEYQVTFKAGGKEFNIYVTLTKDFPNEKPILKVSPAIIHPWINADGEITAAPGLLNFTVHSDLGRIVQVIIREFQRNPPHCNSNVVSPTIPVIDSDAGRGSPSYATGFPGLNSFSPPSHVSVAPNICQSFAFPELNSLSLDELQYLNESANRQEEFLENLPQIREMNKTVDDLILQVEELADSNLSKRERLDEFKKGIDSRLEEVTKLSFESERLHTIYQNLSDKYSPKNIKEQLQLAAERADKDSDKIAESFLNGETDVDKFVKLYLKRRTVCQMRKTKEEKFSQQLNNLEKAGF